MAGYCSGDGRYTVHVVSLAAAKPGTAVDKCALGEEDPCGREVEVSDVDQARLGHTRTVSH